jgi:hypothetical protein
MANIKWLDVLKVVAPIVLNLIPQIPKDVIPVIVDGIVVAEQSDRSGQDKMIDVISHAALANTEVPAIIQGVQAAIAATNAVVIEQSKQ